MATFTLTIAAPPRAVFDYIVEPRHRPEWQASLRSVELVDAGTDGAPLGIGTRWIDHTAIGARPRLRITEFRPPVGTTEPGVWREIGDWRGLHADLAMRFESAEELGSHTRVSGTVRITGAPWWLPVRVVLQALAPAAVRSDLRRAARILASA